MLFRSSLAQTQSASLNGVWLIQTPKSTAPASTSLFGIPFLNSGFPFGQSPSPAPKLVLYNTEFGVEGGMMKFCAQVIGGQFLSYQQVAVTGNQTYQFASSCQLVNFSVQYV